MASAKTRPAQHYIEEWERHPDLFCFDVTAKDPHYAAAWIAYGVAYRFLFPTPTVVTARRPRKTCSCSGPDHCRITLCKDFTAGQLLHELAHAWCFYRYGDHDHGRLFQCAMNDICFWFRLNEEAQGWLFP